MAGVLLSRPDRSWNLRALAAAAGIHPVVTRRSVQDLEALGAVETIRPGRDRTVRLRPDAPATQALRMLHRLDLPDPERICLSAFAAAYRARGVTLIHWRMPEDRPVPGCPVRIALVHAGDADAALDAADAALDAVRGAQVPEPELTPLDRRELGTEDPVAAAVRAGTVLDQSASRM